MKEGVWQGRRQRGGKKKKEIERERESDLSSPLSRLPKRPLFSSTSIAFVRSQLGSCPDLDMWGSGKDLLWPVVVIDTSGQLVGRNIETIFVEKNVYKRKVGTRRRKQREKEKRLDLECSRAHREHFGASPRHPENLFLFLRTSQIPFPFSVRTVFPL